MRRERQGCASALTSYRVYNGVSRLAGSKREQGISCGAYHSLSLFRLLEQATRLPITSMRETQFWSWERKSLTWRASCGPQTVNVRGCQPQSGFIVTLQWIPTRQRSGSNVSKWGLLRDQKSWNAHFQSLDSGLGCVDQGSASCGLRHGCQARCNVSPSSKRRYTSKWLHCQRKARLRSKDLEMDLGLESFTPF